MKRLGVVVACAVLIAACGSNKDEPAKAPAEKDAPEQRGPTSPEPKAVEVAALDGEQVRALVDAWLKAQNEGDFAAYEALYATRFTGTKRIGPRTFKYDRAGWVKDRGRMFKNKMHVSAEGLKVSASSKTAVVQFTQTWASGKFKDVGSKQLIVVPDGGALKIGREEMLSSSVVGADTEGKPLPREKFGFVLNEAGVYLVISTEDVAWKDVPPTLVSRSSPAIATKPADLDALDDALRAWKGRSVALFGPEGGPCETTVQELVVVTGFEPHFATMEAWEASGNAEVAQDIWQGATENARMLVGRVGEECMGALWGRANDKNLVPRLQQMRDGVADLEQAALERLRSLKGYALIQKDYGAKQPWDLDDGASPRFAVFHDRKVGRDFVAVEAVAGPGCGGFYGELWALFQVVDRDGKRDLVLLTDETQPGDLFFPIAVADVDADGDVEFISATAIVRLVGTTYRPTETVSYPSYDCPC